MDPLCWHASSFLIMIWVVCCVVLSSCCSSFRYGFLTPAFPLSLHLIGSPQLFPISGLTILLPLLVVLCPFPSMQTLSRNHFLQINADAVFSDTVAKFVNLCLLLTLGVFL